MALSESMTALSKKLLPVLSGRQELLFAVLFVNDAPLPFRFSVSRGEPLFIRDEEAYYTFVERA
jgi:hypothetical protein